LGRGPCVASLSRYRSPADSEGAAWSPPGERRRQREPRVKALAASFLRRGDMKSQLPSWWRCSGRAACWLSSRPTGCRVASRPTATRCAGRACSSQLAGPVPVLSALAARSGRVRIHQRQLASFFVGRDAAGAGDSLAGDFSAVWRDLRASRADAARERGAAGVSRRGIQPTWTRCPRCRDILPAEARTAARQGCSAIVRATGKKWKHSGSRELPRTNISASELEDG
jgi:hypothetical protein